VTDDQRSSRPIFNATLWAAAGWLFFRVARSTAIQIAALRSRLEKQPTDLRRSPRDLGNGALDREIIITALRQNVLFLFFVWHQEVGYRRLFDLDAAGA